MKYKPVKFVIRYYVHVFVSWEVPYFHRKWDKNSGNKSGVPPLFVIAIYLGNYPVYMIKSGKVDVRLIKNGEFFGTLLLKNGTPEESYLSRNGRLFVTDNLHTSHVLAK